MHQRKKRYLTKSRFKLGLECPTKLFYTQKKEYANQSLEDSFLASLADGGFQVGELAKYYFPGGIDIRTLDQDAALSQTRELLSRDEVVIYEAAIVYRNLFIRADILVKKGRHLDFYEVKAKSLDSEAANPFLTKKGDGIVSTWQPYLHDVAFQRYVISGALPECSVTAHLMLADKSARCPTDGLNQKFMLVRQQGRTTVEVSDSLQAEDLSPPILCRVNVERECRLIYSASKGFGPQNSTFEKAIAYLAGHYEKDKKISSPVTTACAACEFRTTDLDTKAGRKSGLRECWKEQLDWTEQDFEKPTVLDIWNFRGKAKLIQNKKIRMSQVSEDDIKPKEGTKPGLSASERQWLQVEKNKNHDTTVWLDKNNLAREMARWVYPLHFIDFETTMVALPFNAGRRPYEGIAFQFSHHVVHEDGTVEHRSEYLNSQRGQFPNHDFVRRLKKDLENDAGSVFRYSNHENTYLNMIYRQLREDESDMADREELCGFIRTITHSTKDSVETWVGERDMVDMWQMVKQYYYDPATNGSNSIKQVLPAMLDSSTFLQDKYAKPVYGAVGGIRSLNFRDWRWIQMESGKVVDPYLLLPKMFADVSDRDEKILSTGNELHDGGAAMTAYARMQFSQMSEYERTEIRKALLKYCELDTMAMVMIYEGWKDMLA